MIRCRTCRYWGACPAMGRRVAWAGCSFPGKNLRTSQDNQCQCWEEREGEILGLGLQKYWLLSEHHKFFPAGIIHDLRDIGPVDRKEIDRDFLYNCKKLSTNPWDMFQAHLLYSICRAYSLLKGG